LPPIGEEVVNPVGLNMFVQMIYDAFTARGIRFYDQPTENADSWKPKREEENQYHTRRFGDSLTRLHATCVVRRPSLRGV